MRRPSRVDGLWLITGASRGIGAALAREVKRRGGRVALVARDRTALLALATELGGTAHAIDLSDPQAACDLLSTVEAEAGPVDVLVNNAALDLAGDAVSLPPNEVARTVALNVSAPLLLSCAALARMAPRGSGWIVNISSVAASAAFPGMAIYAATKAALSQFSRVVSAEADALGVGVTLASLGPVATTMLDSIYKHEPLRRAFQRAAMLRLSATITAEEAATAIAGAVAAGRKEVVVPARLWPFAALASLPQRFTSSVLLRGISPTKNLVSP